jgi:hypothetical protein
MIVLKKHTLIILTLAIMSCGNNAKVNDKIGAATPQIEVDQKENKAAIALDFINGYVAHSNKMDQSIELIDWVNANKLATNSFKIATKKIVADAYAQDPDLGLEADLILDAQDYPDKGFELEASDDKTNYLTLKGIDLPTFTLTMKMSEENGHWLVDGCGAINIPEEKRAKR